MLSECSLNELEAILPDINVVSYCTRGGSMVLYAVVSVVCLH